MATTKKVYTRLRDMPKELAKAVRERVIALRGVDGLKAPAIAVRI